MKVGILGSGEVGKTLAAGFVKHGHEAMIGSRTPEKLAELTQKNPRVRAGTLEEAAAFGEAVVLAVKGAAAKEAMQMAGVANVNGKIVIDATNPTTDAPPVNGVLKYLRI